MGHHHHNINRRTFLGQASCAAVGMTTLFSTAFNLKALNAASYFNSASSGDFDDYKAIVCILLSGGSDTYNMLVPRDIDNYNEYAATRSNQALQQNELIPINPTNTPSGREFGLHPSMTNMANLFENGNLAFVSNVGSLIEPTNKDGVYNGTNSLPLGLYSHSDQAMHWQTGVPHDRVATGWAGKMADLLNDLPMGPQNNPLVSMNLSLSGTNVFQTGLNGNEFALHPTNGVTGFHGYGDPWFSSQLRTEAVDNMVDATYQDIFKATYANTAKNARDGVAVMQQAFDNATPLTTTFPFTQTGNLSDQLRTVANTINVRDAIGVKRQVFFIEFGGWDHHDELLGSSSTLFQDLDISLSAFYESLEEMGLTDQVTTFSISEFSRTLASNGNGTDHAWGGNMFVMGGAVNGQQIYGTYPQLAFNTDLDLGGGVLIPTLSADEYFAELALWYNVPASGLLDIFPNLGNFYSVTSGQNPIGFLNI